MCLQVNRMIHLVLVGLIQVSTGVYEMALLILAGLPHMFGGWLAVTWYRVVLAGTTMFPSIWHCIYHWASMSLFSCGQAEFWERERENRSHKASEGLAQKWHIVIFITLWWLRKVSRWVWIQEEVQENPTHVWEGPQNHIAEGTDIWIL